jgi:bifunctional lysine-specific demethylase and histidyl-hydroxylase NO66
MRFAELVAPLTPQAFLDEHFGRAPLHIPEEPGAGRRGLLPWRRFNELLAIQSHWSRENIRLMWGGKPVDPDRYMETIPAQGAPIERASTAKVEAQLALGASLVAHSVHQIAPEIRAVKLMLARRFLAEITANIYCSFKGIAALARHHDSHDVFVLQTEGEKVWQVYDRPADRPLFGTSHHKAAEAGVGERPVLLEARMRPGDVIYIPRGFLHEALADTGESLHITFAVAMPTGVEALRTLKSLALHDSLFRAYLPDEPEALRRHLAALGERLGEILGSSVFTEELLAERRKPARSQPNLSLPSRPVLRMFVVRRPAESVVVRLETGPVLRGGTGSEVPVGGFREEAEWILARPMFALEELAASFPHRTIEEIEALVGKLTEAGLLAPAALKD